MTNRRYFSTSPRSKVTRSKVTQAISIAAALALVLTLGFFVSQATAQNEPSSLAAANSGVFVGTDDEGQFQLALEDAVAKAAAAAGCCDIRITYKVLDTYGQHGGFLFLDDIFVKIHAEW